MEYPGKEDKNWKVIAHDRNDVPVLSAHNLSKEDAHRIADKWIGRPDILRVKGYEGKRQVNFEEDGGCIC